jgi:hypothetical protein
MCRFAVTIAPRLPARTGPGMTTIPDIAVEPEIGDVVAQRPVLTQPL